MELLPLIGIKNKNVYIEVRCSSMPWQKKTHKDQEYGEEIVSRLKIRSQKFLRFLQKHHESPAHIVKLLEVGKIQWILQ
jgi:hypothetical protein